MASRELAADYARERLRNHSLAFREALFAISASMTDFGPMNGGPHPQGSDERLRGLAPGLELSPMLAPSSFSQAGGRERMRVLILSWEYPPLIEGGPPGMCASSRRTWSVRTSMSTC